MNKSTFHIDLKQTIKAATLELTAFVVFARRLLSIPK